MEREPQPKPTNLPTGKPEDFMKYSGPAIPGMSEVYDSFPEGVNPEAVNVPRSSGEIEPGWRINEVTDGKDSQPGGEKIAHVQKLDESGEATLSKRIPLSELVNANPAPSAETVADDDETLDGPGLAELREQLRGRSAEPLGRVSLEGAIEGMVQQVEDGDVVNHVVSIEETASNEDTDSPIPEEKKGADASSSAEAQVEVARTVAEHPKVVSWLAEQENPDEARADIIGAVARRVLSSESVTSVEEVVAHELQAIPTEAEEAGHILRRMQGSFDQIGGDVRISKANINRLLEDVVHRHGTDAEAAAGEVRRLQDRVGGWIGEARRQGFQGEELAAFANRAVEKSGALMHQVEVSGSDLQYGVRGAQAHPEDYDQSEQALALLDELDEQVPVKSFIDEAYRDIEEVHGLFDALHTDTRRVGQLAGRVWSADLFEPIESFPLTANNLMHELDDLQRGIRSNNSDLAARAGSRIKQQLDTLEQQAEAARRAAGNNFDNLNAVEPAVNGIKSSMRSARERFQA